MTEKKPDKAVKRRRTTVPHEELIAGTLLTASLKGQTLSASVVLGDEGKPEVEFDGGRWRTGTFRSWTAISESTSCASWERPPPRLRVSSTPTISDFAISYLFEMSDQCHYEMLCSQCGTWQEPSFPDSVDWDAGRVVCLNCRCPLDPFSEGRWVPRQPGQSEIRGYQLNRLSLPHPPLRDMKLALDGKLPTTKETFYRQDLGHPFTSPESRLTPDILDPCTEAWRPQAPLRMYVMGIDVGSKLHVVIRGRLKDRWYLFEAFTVDSFEDIEGCFECYNIQCCVVDALPETREARRFQKAHPGVVWLAQYVQQGLEPEWSYRDGLVKAPRTVILDETLQRFREGTYALPSDVRALADGEYFRHL